MNVFITYYDRKMVRHYGVWSIQGGLKKVSCCTVSTAYFFWATLYIILCITIWSVTFRLLLNTYLSRFCWFDVALRISLHSSLVTISLVDSTEWSRKSENCTSVIRLYLCILLMTSHDVAYVWQSVLRLNCHSLSIWDCRSCMYRHAG